MSQPELLDFEALLAPISESEPCGSRFESGENAAFVHAFNELRPLTPIARKIEAKRYELAALSPTERKVTLEFYQGKSDGPQSDPRWERIYELSLEILTRHSKDTRVMVNLIESMTRLFGLEGLRDSLKATSQLLQRYQLQLYPHPEQGDPAFYCLEPIGRLCESETNNIRAAIHQADIFDNNPGYCYYTHLSAITIAKKSLSEQEEYAQAGDLTLDMFDKAISEFDDLEQLDAFDQRIGETLAEAKVLDSLLGSQSGNRVGITRIVDDLQSLQRWYRGLTEDQRKVLEASAPLASDAEDTTGVEGSSKPTQGGAVSGAINSRQQALDSLLKVAAYFRSTEPHSPLSYALEQAVRWGKMPLPELLRELVGDDNVLSEMYRRMGIRENQDNS